MATVHIISTMSEDRLGGKQRGLRWSTRTRMLLIYM